VDRALLMVKNEELNAGILTRGEMMMDRCKLLALSLGLPAAAF
jgi:hypothetical protein